MNIAFLSSLNPKDIHSWSGTLYYMFHEIAKRHYVEWIGGSLYSKMQIYHKGLYGKDSVFHAEDYSKEFGAVISMELQSTYYDVVLCRDYFFLAYISTEIPILYIGDTTFQLFNSYMGIKDKIRIDLYNEIERLAITNATAITYPTPWAKESAISYYGRKSKDIDIIEFGANLSDVQFYKHREITNNCNLLFIGTNWNMKGGEKVITIYRKLKGLNLNCKLTIIGSTPPYSLDDPDMTVYPTLDKNSKEDSELYSSILDNSDVLLVPTLFDCYGIVYCEAAAYGIVVLTNNVCGVSHVIKNGKTGYLFDTNTPSDLWAEKIREIIISRKIDELSHNARKEFEQRLNRHTWGGKIESLIKRICPAVDTYIPIFAINLPERTDRKEHILLEFSERKEFELNFVDASRNINSRLGLWQSIVRIVRNAAATNEQFVAICEDDHFFTKNYSPNLLMTEMQLSFQLGADILSGGIGGFGRALKRAFHLYEVDWFWCTQFIVIYSSLFDSILSYDFKEQDTADGVLSELAHKKMVIYPFISEQKDFGYSDVTRSNQENAGKIREHFKRANQMFEYLEQTSYNL